MRLSLEHLAASGKVRTVVRGLRQFGTRGCPKPERACVPRCSSPVPCPALQMEALILFIVFKTTLL